MIFTLSYSIQVLVNGSDGIGTGWSTSVPTYNPREIIANIRLILSGQQPSVMKPWYRGFTGEVDAKNTTTYAIAGRVSHYMCICMLYICKQMLIIPLLMLLQVELLIVSQSVRVRQTDNQSLVNVLYMPYVVVENKFYFYVGHFHFTVLCIKSKIPIFPLD